MVQQELYDIRLLTFSLIEPLFTFPISGLGPEWPQRQLVLSTSQDGDSLGPGTARWAQPLSAKAEETVLLAELGWPSCYGWHLE
jgi:hypothetical protein